MLQHLTPVAGNEEFICGPGLQRTIDDARRAALSSRTVLLMGETGTGKARIARLIHEHSDRRDRPFIVWSAPEESETLGRRQLFGHVRGAFTGADQDSTGVLEAAHTGTLVFDDVDKTGSELQGALLRFLDDSTVKRLGSNRETRVDVRLVITANRPFEDLVQQNLFLPDLAYRLEGLKIHIPPLRERSKDLPMLIRHFVDRFSAVYDCPSTHFTRSAIKLLTQQPWPGNIRQLSAIVENLIFHSFESGRVGVSEVKGALKGGFKHAPLASPSRNGRLLITRQELVDALDSVRWNSVIAAQRLKIPLRTMRRKMQEFGLARGKAVGVRL